MDAYLDSLKMVAARTQSPKLRKAVTACAHGEISPDELNRMVAAKPENSAFFLSATQHSEVRHLTNRIHWEFKGYDNNRSFSR
jgi:tellurite resistance protein